MPPVQSRLPQHCRSEVQEVPSQPQHWLHEAHDQAPQHSELLEQLSPRSWHGWQVLEMHQRLPQH